MRNGATAKERHINEQDLHLGAGAIGGFMAARLHEAGAQVSLIAEDRIWRQYKKQDCA